jgi:predicted ATP-grasp superfamily ATP-dependent carboligase
MSLKAVEIIETSPIKNGDYRIVLGFAGAGFIGNTATMYTVRARGFKQVAYLKSNHLPPMTLIINGSPIQSFRIHIDENERIIFVVTESLIPTEGCRPIAMELLKWLKSKGAKEVYSIEGLPFSNVSSEIKALVYSNKIDLMKLGYPSVKEGALSGVNSCIMDQCLDEGFPFACFFVPTNKLTSIDYPGSADAIDILNKMFKLGVDPSRLRGVDQSQRTTEKTSGLGKIFKKG